MSKMNGLTQEKFSTAAALKSKLRANQQNQQ
jgi:hypothetical protein